MSDRPHILFITADQLRWDCLGCAGHPVVQTPHIDRLAHSGIAFTSAYVPATLCVPSRQSILSGMYPSAHGARGNRSALPETTPMLPALLRQAGYHTAAFGKMHFRPTYARYGFDLMQLAEQDGEGRLDDDYHSRYLAGLGLEDTWDLIDQVKSYRDHAPADYWQTYGAQVSSLPDEHYHTTWIADRAIDYLSEAAASDTPFFAWLSFIKPHHPFDPPAPYDRLYDPAAVTLPEPRDGWEGKPLLTAFGDPRAGYFDVRAMTEAQLRRVAALYYGLITHLDHHIGRVLAALAAHGLAERTLVIFASDHGDYLGQYGLFLKHPNVPYDALAKVPFIFAGAGVNGAGRLYDAPVSLLDLLPTLVDLAGAGLPPFYQGMSLAPLLDDAEARLHSRPVFCETEGDIKMVRTERYKYLYGGGIEELYDLDTDPLETQSIAALMPDIAAQHRALLLDWLIECGWDRWAYQPGHRSVPGQ